MDLPQAFLDRIRQQLGAEYEAFLDSYLSPPSYGLRMNPLKGKQETSASCLPFTLSPVVWEPDGYHAIPEERPGRHPLHEAGAYYIQEPSAMSVVSLLDPVPGDIVLDLCAAPGGKSTQIAGRLAGQGLLVSNEIVPGRAKILSQNIERMGVSETIVCQEEPSHLAKLFPGFFDKILVDAPCSGEGMFRKDENAVREWSPEQVAFCAERQHEILAYAETMLKPGGILVYSTCTFAPAEDEEQVQAFLREHPNYTLEDWHTHLPHAQEAAQAGIRSGSLPGTMRLWPHLVQGEGHFAARLHKVADVASSHVTDASLLGRSVSGGKRKQCRRQTAHPGKHTPNITALTDWWDASLISGYARPDLSRLQTFGEECYLLPSTIHTLQGIRVLRAGLHLGSWKKNRFEPAHALAKCLKPSDVLSYYECSPEEAAAYLHGETLHAVPSERNTQARIQTLHGWTLICCEGYSLGWAKANQTILKNHYPKGLRTQY